MNTNEFIATERLTKNFGGRAVLSGIDARVRPGDVVGLLGANGAGKTTLLEVLLGLSPPSMGSAQLFGTDAIAAPAEAKARIGYVPQSDDLIGELKGSAYLDLIATFYPRWDTALVERLVASWGISTSTASP